VHRIGAKLLGQRRPVDLDEFAAFYRKTLDRVCSHAQHVIAVSPGIRGERLDNGWNDRLALLSSIIEGQVGRRLTVEYLDLKPAFARVLDGKAISDYLTPGPTGVLRDLLTLRGDAHVDAIAARRGLHLTLDGVHLNSAGAHVVAHEFARIIDRSPM
jgi:hypothetical protein